ncbi:beta-glucuronosyltransferase GlcAT14A-like [Rutidosis leptorrhynchoides]|uniref:beta-glucuronosyltransferase GlcAT14A-like n=1 Tax=Rutidosis leptorrhynchoides TaxID=125765 RepID=UPI003A9924E5
MEAPKKNRTIIDAPSDKVGFYLDFLHAGYCFPTSNLLKDVLKQYGFHISQLHPNAYRRILCFELLCGALHIEPELKVFRYFYGFSAFGEWFNFCVRKGRGAISTGIKGNIHHWQHNFFWVDKDLFPSLMQPCGVRVSTRDKCPKLTLALQESAELLQNYIVFDRDFPRAIVMEARKNNGEHGTKGGVKDLLHILSYVPKDLNFVNHTSYIGWKESRMLKPVVVDPGLFLNEPSEIFYGTQKRPLPDAYRLFTGKYSDILSRKFVEFCILGTENLPRTLLMYLSNSLSSQSVYFPTVLCNSPRLNRTVVNHNLQYSAYVTKHEPRTLNSDDFNDLINSGTAFASPFLVDDPVLDRIDQELLNRGQGKPVPGGWCLGDSNEDACSLWGDADVLKPGSGAKRLEQHMVELLSNETFNAHQCIFE